MSPYVNRQQIRKSEIFLDNRTYSDSKTNIGGIPLKRVFCLILAAALLSTSISALEPLYDDAITIQAPSACLLEKTTGQVLYEKNAHERRLIASVTKVMTLLLVMEALDDGTIALDDMVTASSHAASMGGSQIWLEEGEQMTVDEMIKCVTVVSANDCAVALAEHIAGTETAFVQKMNEKAAELGMEDTHFTDCTGLFDDTNHYSSAYDVALMARALISHEKIKDYSTIWMDTARNGEFNLSNTNKLIYYYEGATGLKTGFTSSAKYCLAATAQRDGVEYVAVVLGADSTDQRFDSAKTLLSYAFANYTLCQLHPGDALPPILVNMGTVDSVQPVYPEQTGTLLEKSKAANLRYDLQLQELAEAPVQAGDPLGTLTVYAGEEQVAQFTVTAGQTVERLSVFGVFSRLLDILFCKP